MQTDFANELFDQLKVGTKVNISWTDNKIYPATILTKPHNPTGRFTVIFTESGSESLVQLHRISLFKRKRTASSTDNNAPSSKASKVSKSSGRSKNSKTTNDTTCRACLGAHRAHTCLPKIKTTAQYNAECYRLFQEIEKNGIDVHLFLKSYEEKFIIPHSSSFSSLPRSTSTSSSTSSSASSSASSAGQITAYSVSSGSSSSLQPPPQPEKMSHILRRHKRRCDACDGCLAVDCGTCRFCLDKKTYGGNGVLRKACMYRKCTNPQKARQLDTTLGPKKVQTKHYKDPNKPKRWRSSYLYYCAEQRPIIKAANPMAKNTDHVTLMGAGWSALSDAQKVPYQALSEIDKNRYFEEMKAYVPPAAGSLIYGKSHRAKKMRKSIDPNKPKQGMSAYLFYCKEQRPRVTAANSQLVGQAKNTEIMTLLGTGWNKLSSDEKIPYQRKAKIERDKYMKAMETYALYKAIDSSSSSSSSSSSVKVGVGLPIPSDFGTTSSNGQSRVEL